MQTPTMYHMQTLKLQKPKLPTFSDTASPAPYLPHHMLQQ